MKKAKRSKAVEAFKAVDVLLVEIFDQYERRRRMYESAGGDPKKMQGELTCYLPYDMLREVFDASTKPRR